MKYVPFSSSFFLFFFFAFPSYISGDHHFWVRFLHMWPFFNPTIKVVTFRRHGWCVLGVFFVAGIHLSRTWTSGSFESVQWNACVYRLDLGLYSHPKEFLGKGVWTHVNSKGKIPSTRKFSQRRIESATLWTASPNTTNKLFRPPEVCSDRAPHDLSCIYSTNKQLGGVISGKYPHLLVSTNGKPSNNLGRDNLEAVINFGPVPVGSKNTKWVELHNLSPVRPVIEWFDFDIIWSHFGGYEIISYTWKWPHTSEVPQ